MSNEEQQIERLKKEILSPVSTTEEQKRGIDTLVTYGKKAIDPLMDISESPYAYGVKDYCLKAIQKIRTTS